MVEYSLVKIIPKYLGSTFLGKDFRCFDFSKHQCMFSRILMCLNLDSLLKSATVVGVSLVSALALSFFIFRQNIATAES